MASCVGGAKERAVPEYEALFVAAGITAPATLVPSAASSLLWR